MKKTMFVWIFLISIVFIALMAIGLKYTKSISKYKELENDLVEAAQSYINIKELNMNNNFSLKITEDELKAEKILPNMEIDDDKCTGYLEVRKNINGIKIIPFLTCKNYKTEK